MKITIIGGGNMGGAIARGLINSGYIAAADLTISDQSDTVLEAFAALGCVTTKQNSTAVIGADLVIMAVKPWIVPSVCALIRLTLSIDTPLAIVAAGVSFKDVIEHLKRDTALFIVMPNTAAEVRESMTLIAANKATDKEKALVEETFSQIGEVFFTEESLMSAATAVCGCGTAYALRYIRAATEAAVQLGFRADVASRLVAQTVKGASQILLTNNTHPEVEIDKVTTPGGWTIRGLNAMEHAGFSSAVIKGIKDSMNSPMHVIIKNNTNE